MGQTSCLPTPCGAPCPLRGGQFCHIGRGQHPGGDDVPTKGFTKSLGRKVTARACSTLDDVTLSTTQLRQSIWLLGRGSRGLHTTGPEGETEQALARKLLSCAFYATRWDLNSLRHRAQDSSDLTVELSQRYRRDLFLKDSPVDPVSNSDLILAFLVVVPEAVAVLLLLLQRRGPPHRRSRWRWRNALVQALVVIAGAIALVGVGYQDRQEHLGHTWRAATVRTGTLLEVNETEQKYMRKTHIDYRGHIVTRCETLFLVAQTGYRPHVTRRLLVVSVVAFAV